MHKSSVKAKGNQPKGKNNRAARKHRNKGAQGKDNDASVRGIVAITGSRRSRRKGGAK